MPISSWSNWPLQSPRRPRSPSSDLTSAASSAFPSPTPSFSFESRESNKEVIAGEDGVGRALKFLVPKVRFAWWHRPRKPQEQGLEVYLRALRRFSLRELQVATNNFVDESILNRCSYWIVYRGILADGSLVIVKKLTDVTPGMESNFQSEIKMISLAVHKNLLRLRGFCMTSTEWLLVYPYMARRLSEPPPLDMANGSLASRRAHRLSEPPPLDWPSRKRIALEIARGLSYLHENCLPAIIHCDVNAANILLDENLVAHLGDFGFTRVVNRSDTLVIISGRGTVRHIAPEFLSTGKCSEKTDVFAYGITLLELINGERGFNLAWLANEDVNDVILLDWVEGLLLAKMFEEFVDPELDGNYVEAEVESVLQLALLCSQGTPVDRPKMSEVVRMLEAEDHAEITERWEEFKKLFDERRWERELTYHELWRFHSTDDRRHERELIYHESQISVSTEHHQEKELTYHELLRYDSTDDLASIELSSPR